MAIHDAFYTNSFRDKVGFHGLKQTAQHVEFIARTIPLRKENEILDLAYGFGRHSIELAAMGYRVTGVDRSADYLTEAAATAKTRGLSVRFVQADMRQMHEPCRFDVVLSLATSLAFYDEATNLDIFRRVCAALRPGGTFLFDQGNIFWLVKNYVPKPYSLDASTCIVSARQTADSGQGRIEAGWDLRFFNLPELKAIMASNGMEFVKCFGDLDGSAFCADSKRLVTIWRKPPVDES